MRTKVCALIFLSAFISLYASAQDQSANSNLKTLVKRVDDYLNSYVNAHDFSGVVLIGQGDQVLYEKAYGIADTAIRTHNKTSTVFRIASLSKTFTAAAISMLVEQGKVGLLDPLNRFIPDFPNGAKIQIRQLLLHSSGVGQLDSPDLAGKCPSTSELVKLIAAIPPQFPPGSDNRYSNEGYVLLAAVIEKASGMSYETFLNKNIFAPLGMTRTGVMCSEWRVKDHATGSIAGLGNGTSPLPFDEAGWNGPGSLYSTSGDLLIWLKAVSEDKLFKFSQLEYPYGWGKRDYSGKPSVEQSGQLEGYNAHMALYPQQKLYFVFLSNIESGMFNRLPKDFEALVFGGTPSVAPAVNEIRAVAKALQPLAGDYVAPTAPVPLRFVVADGRLWLHWGEDPFLRPLIMTGKDVFFLRAEYATLTFRRDVQGNGIAVSYRFGDGEPLLLSRVVEKLP